MKIDYRVPFFLARRFFSEKIIRKIIKKSPEIEKNEFIRVVVNYEKSVIDKIGEMMKTVIHVYRCVKLSCQNIRQVAKFPRPSIRCDICGSAMIKIDERRVDK